MFFLFYFNENFRLKPQHWSPSKELTIFRKKRFLHCETWNETPTDNNLRLYFAIFCDNVKSAWR